MTQLFLVPFRRNRRFVGREDQLAQLHQQLQDHRTTGITGLTGMGGIGKTQLAVEYVYRAREQNHYPDGIFWLNAARPLRGEFATLGQTLQTRQAQAEQPPLDLAETLTTAFTTDEIREVMFELDIPDGDLPEDKGLRQALIGYCARRGRIEELATEVLRQRPHLQRQATAWQEKSQEEEIGQAINYLQGHSQSLVVLDNLEDLTRLEQPIYRDLIPADLPCCLLFTSRQTYIGGQSLNLNGLPAAAALELLLSDPRRQPVLAKPDSDEHKAARSTCKILGYLPLALEILSVYLGETFPDPIAECQDELINWGALPVLDDLQDVETMDERHRVGLTAILQKQWEGLSAAAKEVLKVAGQLPEAAILPVARLQLLSNLPTKRRKPRDVTIGQTVQQLLDTSLMERLQAGQVRLHPLVREFAQNKTGDPDQFRCSCAEHLSKSYEDFVNLELNFNDRGIFALQADIVSALALLPSACSSSTSDHLKTLLRLLQYEMQTIQNSQSQHLSSFFLQQVAKRALEMGLISWWQDVEALLAQQGASYWKVNWATKQISPALKCSLSGHKWEILSVAITPDGKKAISGSHDGTVRLWDVESGTQERIVGKDEGNVSAVAITPDGKKAISASGPVVKIWNLESGEYQMLDRVIPDWVYTVAITPDGKKAIFAFKRSIKLWSLQSGKEERTHTEEKFIGTVTITPDGQKVGFVCNNSIKIWNPQSGQIEQDLPGHKNWGTIMAFTLNGEKAICSLPYYDGLNMWDLKSGEKELTFPDYSRQPDAVAITPDGKKVVYSSTKNDLKVLDLSSGEEEFTLSGHSGLIKAIAITSDSQTIVSASYDKTLKVWDISTPMNTKLQTGQVASPSGHESIIKTVTITANGQKAISVSADHTLKIWNLQTGQIEQTLFSNLELANAVSITPDGEKAIIASDRSIKLWDLQSGKEERTHTEVFAINAVAVTPNGKKAIFVSSNFKLWNLQTGEIECSKHGSTYAVAVTFDNKKAVYADGNSLNVWNLQTRQTESILSDQTYRQFYQREKAANYNLDEYIITAIAVTPDGQKVIVASRDHVIRVWNLEGALEKTLFGHTDWINAIAVTSDGYYAVSASDDRSLKVWNLLEGRERVSINLDESLFSVAIAPDDTTVVTGDRSGNIHCLRLMLRKDVNE